MGVFGAGDPAVDPGLFVIAPAKSTFERFVRTFLGGRFFRLEAGWFHGCCPKTKILAQSIGDNDANDSFYYKFKRRLSTPNHRKNVKRRCLPSGRSPMLRDQTKRRAGRSPGGDRRIGSSYPSDAGATPHPTPITAVLLFCSRCADHFPSRFFRRAASCPRMRSEGLKSLL